MVRRASAESWVQYQLRLKGGLVMTETTTLAVNLPATIYEALQQAAERSHKTTSEIALEAIDSYLQRPSGVDALLGLFADEPELVQNALEDVMQSRETARLRTS